MDKVFDEIKYLWNADLGYLFLLCICGLFLLPLDNTEILIQLHSPYDTKGEVFFTTADGYSPTQRVAFKINQTTDFRQYSISLRTAKKLNKIRFDLGIQPGDVRVSAIQVATYSGTLNLQPEELSRQIIPLHQVAISATDKYVEITSSGPTHTLKLCYQQICSKNSRQRGC